ncbi:MAG: hypothetical protein GY874_19325 [Desulfobacteraceae bacterium]|nr:hypothetical protein [Desulfobacteraceae bacterium]
MTVKKVIKNYKMEYSQELPAGLDTESDYRRRCRRRGNCGGGTGGGDTGGGGGSSSGSCPDDTVEMVFATSEDDLPSAISAVENLADMASDQGYNVETLTGKEENTQAVKDWLSCSDLKLYGRIGHGSQSGIMVSDGVVKSQYFSGLSSTELENKVLFFNSCDVHNPPLEPAIVGAGVQKFIGGDNSLGIGSSEKVFECWLDEVLAGDAMSSAIKSCSSAQPSAGSYGISGDGSDILE